MIALTLCGAVVGAGLALVLSSLRPAAPPLDLELSRLDDPAPPASGPFGLRWRLGMALARWLEAWGLPPSRLRADLALLAIPSEPWGVHVTLGTLVLMAIGVLGLFGVSVLGVPTPPWAVVAVVVLACSAGVGLPARAVHTRARRAREHFRQIFASWLELVTLGQAGGAGVEEAMAAACDLGDDWALRRIAGALAAGRGAGLGPWEGLRALAAEVGVDDLARVAASLSLAGTEGARVRASLASAAASLRAAVLSEAEAKANALTERLFLPATLLAVGFMLFVLYPALSRVLTSLGGS
ncbi:MAG TPA: type II secretion system F family protein [Acidimicrobiales bacterium]|nr:type II secretion system F family protein [Acidimicrobiales bacterium]